MQATSTPAASAQATRIRPLAVLILVFGSVVLPAGMFVLSALATPWFGQGASEEQRRTSFGYLVTGLVIASVAAAVLILIAILRWRRERPVLFRVLAVLAVVVVIPWSLVVGGTGRQDGILAPPTNTDYQPPDPVADGRYVLTDDRRAVGQAALLALQPALQKVINDPKKRTHQDLVDAVDLAGYGTGVEFQDDATGTPIRVGIVVGELTCLVGSVAGTVSLQVMGASADGGCFVLAGH